VECKKLKVRYVLIFLLSFAHIFVSNCNFDNSYFSDLNDLNKLYEGIRKEYKVNTVQVKLHNETSLTVNLVNSKFNDLEEPAKREKAREIVKYIVKNYKDSNKLESIGITYGVHRNYIICNFRSSLDTHFFEKQKNKWILKENEE
jgi:hypothetical protein